MNALEILTQLWPVGLSFVGLIAWIVRLQAQVQSLEISHAKLIEKHEALDSKVMDQLASMRESLARIEGALGVKV
jgi:hypothetical protein